jgi:hypothetical protein
MRNADGTQWLTKYGWAFEPSEKRLMTEQEAAYEIAYCQLSKDYQTGDYGIYQLKTWDNATNQQVTIEPAKLDSRAIALFVFKDGAICDAYETSRNTRRDFELVYSMARHNNPERDNIVITTSLR